MTKNKKIILIVIAIVIILVITAGLIYWIGFASKKDAVLDGSTSKVAKLYSELIEQQTYSFSTTLDEQNATYYVKNNNMAYIETTYQGRQSKFVIKDGNSYLLMDNQKTYYTYRNNETDLEKITLALQEVKDNQYTKGKEKIGNKSYKYEEYELVTEFLVKDIEIAEDETVKTRFYFNGDKLVYIKTIIGDYQEVLKVDISYNVDNNLFEIPSDYKGA